MLVLHLMLVISPKGFITTCRSRRLCTRWCITKCSTFPWKYCLQNIKSCILIYKNNCDIQIIKLVKMQCIWVSYQEMQFYFIIIKTVHKVPIIFWWQCRSLRLKADMAYFYEKILTPLHHSSLLLYDSITNG